MGDVSVSQVPNKMSNEKYNLCSNNFSNTAVSTIQNLVTDTEYTDVTLVSDDRRKIKAHKVILASASQFFREILPEISSHNPVLFLKGIEHSELLAIIRFVYVGTTEVAQDNLDKFMKAAQDLQVEGLQEKRKEESMKYYQDTKNNDEECHRVKTQEKSYSGYETKRNHESFELALYQEPFESPSFISLQNSHFEKNADGTYFCDECDHQTTNVFNLKRHKLGKHEGVRYKCDECDREFVRKDNLQTHKQSKHEGKKYPCEQCGSEFSHPTNLSKHKAKSHNVLY